MKPVYLEFCGVNSFSEPARIDFSRLLEYGIFGIFGDTGSGKSTILDCIGFALYGGVARSRSGSIADVINDRSDKAYVNFEFEIHYDGKRRRLRVERELKRKNAVQSVKVYEYNESGAAVALSEGVRESNALLEKMIGLEQKDFEKCIALPQGEFAQFVRASRSDRLKLVSRLFDLEDYGEKLVRKANAKSAKAAEELRVIGARMESYVSVTEEGLSALREELPGLIREESDAKEGLAAKREEEKRLTALLAIRLEAEENSKKLALLDEKREEMRILGEELGRIGSAAEAVKAAKAASAADLAREEGKRALELADRTKSMAEERARALAAWDSAGADDEISRLAEACVLSEQREKEQKKRAETERQLARLRTEYMAEAEKFKGFSYESERAALQEKLDKLGGGDFLAFAEEHGKAALLRREYSLFAEELREIVSRCSAAEEWLSPLIEKYDALSSGEKTDFSSLKERFSAREQTRVALNAALVSLEKKNGLYRAHLERMQQLRTDGVRLKEELEELGQAGDTPAEDTGTLRQRLAQAKTERAEKARAREGAQRALSDAAAAYAAAAEKQNALETACAETRERLRERLSAGGMSSVAEAESLVKKYGDPVRSQARLNAYREEYAAVSARQRELKKEPLPEVTRESISELRETLALQEKECEEIVRRLALKKEELRRMSESLEQKRALERESAQARRRAELSERLKKLFEGNKFMDFVAEEYLQNVAQNASGRLLSLTDGRYFLRYRGGASGFMVGDNFNGGKERGVHTLSGGETFLVSLSLALALSAEICAKSLRPIEFFFLDEGFGTLDERLVDTVMDSLERLKGENFAIGIISHVEELKHRIGRRLLVQKANEERGSKIYAE